MAEPGRIVVLNGVPRSGKSSIVRAVQAGIEGRWVNLGVDVYNRAMPESLLPGIGLRPGGERPDLEPVLPGLYRALYETIAVHARAGFDVVADLGHHDAYSVPLGILPACAHVLAELPAVLVGVDCPDEVVIERRRADAQGGFYSADPAMVRRWREAVHEPGVYDLRVDTAVMSPQACADRIGAVLADPPVPGAFARLARM